jgi:peptidoglycan/LPS O-acetylase OafA/YrhL
MMHAGAARVPTVPRGGAAPSPPRRLGTLDALRGLAAVAVMLFHYLPHYHFLFRHPFRPFGWTGHLNDGVLLFFMISGFVIPQSAARARSAPHFLAARFARLYPAYWVAMLVTFAVMVGYKLAPLAPYAAGWGDVPANFTMFPLWLGHRAIDYSYWTLAVEICFYIIVAGIFALDLDRHLEAVSLVWLAAALAYYIHVGSRAALVLFFLPFPRDWYAGMAILQYAPYFISGMMLWKIHQRAARVLTYITLAGATVCTYLYSGPTVMFCDYLVFVAILWFVRRLGWLATKPLLWLGSISYALYLIHQYIGYAVIYSAYRAGAPPLVAISLAIGVSLGLAWLLRTFVEQPSEVVVKRYAYAVLDRMMFRTRPVEPGAAPQQLAVSRVSDPGGNAGP